MASVRDSSEVKLIGFEQGINLRTIEQLRNQTRARFQPLANPKVVLNDKSDKKPSLVLRIKDIPKDPGDGLYNLHIESFKGSGSDLKIRVVSSYKAKTNLTITNNVSKTIYDAGASGALHNKNFVLADSKGNFLTVTLKFDISRTTRNSSTSWDVSLAGIDNTSDTTVRNGIASKIHLALSQVSSDKDLDISASLNANVIAITQNKSGEIGNLANSGTLISSSFITLPSFSTGKNGLLRTLNTGDLRHPRDNNAFALGLMDAPGYYVGEPNAVPYDDVINSSIQKIKKITFDLNNIINYNASTSGVTSRIIQDDTLLLTQEVGSLSVESGIGKKIKQEGLNNSSPETMIFGLENWKLTTKAVNDFMFHDLLTEGKKADASSRSATLLLAFPDLSFYRPSSNLKIRFFHIRYDILNTRISKNPLLDSKSNAEIDFYIINGDDNTDPVRIIRKNNSEIEVLIKSFSGEYGNDSSKIVSFRKKLFIERLRTSLERLNKNFHLKLELETISADNEEYSIKVTENKTRLTYFKAFSETKVATDKSQLYITFSNDYRSFMQENRVFRIYDRETNSKKLIQLIPNRAEYGSYRITQDGANSVQYQIGIKGVTSLRDFKDRFFDAILLAKDNDDIDLTPSTKNAYARIAVTNGSDPHGTTPLTDRITIKSSSGNQKTYTIVHGGRGGSKAVPTGEKLIEGSKYAPGLAVPSSNAAIGTIAVNIRSNFSKRDVLNELASAMNTVNGHNSGLDNHVISAFPMDPNSPSTQYLHLKQRVPGTIGNNAITKNGFSIFTIIGFINANNYISKNCVKLQNTVNNGTPYIPTNALDRQRNFYQIGPNINAQNAYTLEDFSDSVITIEMRDGADQNSYYLKPNHDVEVRSFGFGQRTSDLRFYEDLSLNGPKLHLDGYNRTLNMDPVFFVKSDSSVRFPIQVNNLGSSLGFEHDGVIEPLGIRDLMLGRVITEKSIKGLSGELGGEYAYSSIRKESYEISNKITFEKSKNVAFFDNCPGISDYMKGYQELGVNFADPAETAERDNVFYSRVPGVIFKNDSRIQPYIDTEEVIFRTNPLNGNNPETNEMDILVLTLQEMNSNIVATRVAGNESLGGENFRRKAGYDYSSPHPGTDSIVFSGLRYV